MNDRAYIISRTLENKIAIAENTNQNTLFVTLGALKEILALLKEQEAVPVIQREIAHMLFWCCGSCGVAITDGDKFCRMCGRRMKWND